MIQCEYCEAECFDEESDACPYCGCRFPDSGALVLDALTLQPIETLPPPF